MEVEIKSKGKLESEVKEEQLIELLSFALITTPAGTGISDEVSDHVHPGVFVVQTQGRAKAAAPMAFRIKQGAQPVWIKQFFLIFKDRKEIQPIIDHFQKLWMLVE